VTRAVGSFEHRAAILTAWQRRCEDHDLDPARCTGSEAQSLVQALVTAFQAGSPTAELGRAGRAWGSLSSSPAQALRLVACLREVLMETWPVPAHGSETAAPTESPGAGEGDAAAAHQRPGVAEALEARETSVPNGTGWTGTVPTPAVLAVLDRLMLDAVDAASGTLRAEARTDALTGCANRLALREELVRALGAATRSGLDLAVAVIDLDGLKAINDTGGHAAGDAALRSLASTLRGSLRAVDTVYRTGGDEFVVVSPLTDAAGAAAMLRRATRAGAPAFSWGVAGLHETGGEAFADGAVLMATADADLYERRRRRRAVPADPARAAQHEHPGRPSPARRTRRFAAHRGKALAPTVAVLVLGTTAAFGLAGAVHHPPAVPGAATPGAATPGSGLALGPGAQGGARPRPHIGGRQSIDAGVPAPDVTAPVPTGAGGREPRTRPPASDRTVSTHLPAPSTVVPEPTTTVPAPPSTVDPVVPTPGAPSGAPGTPVTPGNATPSAPAPPAPPPRGAPTRCGGGRTDHGGAWHGDGDHGDGDGDHGDGWPPGAGDTHCDSPPRHPAGHARSCSTTLGSSASTTSTSASVVVQPSDKRNADLASGPETPMASST